MHTNTAQPHDEGLELCVWRLGLRLLVAPGVQLAVRRCITSLHLDVFSVACEAINSWPRSPRAESWANLRVWKEHMERDGALQTLTQAPTACDIKGQLTCVPSAARWPRRLTTLCLRLIMPEQGHASAHPFVPGMK